MCLVASYCAAEMINDGTSLKFTTSALWNRKKTLTLFFCIISYTPTLIRSWICEAKAFQCLFWPPLVCCVPRSVSYLDEGFHQKLKVGFGVISSKVMRKLCLLIAFLWNLLCNHCNDTMMLFLVSVKCFLNQQQVHQICLYGQQCDFYFAKDGNYILNFLWTSRQLCWN